RQMEMLEVPRPEITDKRDVLIKLSRVGVCGSDVHYYTKGHIGSRVVEYPFTVGHESAETVAAVASAVTRFHAGDPVAIDPAMPCGECDQCRQGRAHTCRDMHFLGCPGQAEGSLSEYIVMPEDSCFPLRSAGSMEDGALSESVAIGVYACQLAGALRGKRVAILGADPIGLSVLLSAYAAGVDRVYITDRIKERLRVAERCGADWCGNPDSEDIVATISERESLLLDFLFECCDQQEAIDQAMALLKPGGKLLLIGIPETERISFEMDAMRRKEICIQNVRRQNGCASKTIQMLEDSALDARAMVTHRFPFERAKEASDLVTEYGGGGVKARTQILPPPPTPRTCAGRTAPFRREPRHRASQLDPKPHGLPRERQRTPHSRRDDRRTTGLERLELRSAKPFRHAPGRARSAEQLDSFTNSPARFGRLPHRDTRRENRSLRARRLRV
ncbi:MAG: alcohol dehydrogenase catalytic domain-containing protein, partial [Candidatus Hydrogenedentes bacterium]|nr:alcohol dehydrogenase catalytic domain-containing protein [Candidatus Hydrogenedentota bacterium]